MHIRMYVYMYDVLVIVTVAVNKLPSFLAAPNRPDNKPLPHHECTIHLNCEDSDLIHQAFLAAQHGQWFDRYPIQLANLYNNTWYGFAYSIQMLWLFIL